MRTVLRSLMVAGVASGLLAPAVLARPPLVPPLVPRPVIEAPEPPIDLSHAVPASALSKLPPTAEQFRSLKNEIAKDRPVVTSAKAKSDTLGAEARALKTKLIATAARIEDLERDTAALNANIVRLEAQDARLTASLVRDRVPVTRLLAILERLQHDLPPAMVLKPDDALGAARGAMLIGASLPAIYGRAAALAHRIETLQATRTALLARRTEARATATSLAAARGDLDVLLAQKQREANDAAGDYNRLRMELTAVAVHASDLQALLARVAQLRSAGPADQDIVTVTGDNSGGALRRGTLLTPVIGVEVPSLDGPVPGLTFATADGAQVVAPADSKVLFAGPYHKSGHVLILEITTGYDLVLAGLGRVTVRPDDELLAGEPVGNMPVESEPTGDKASAERLYFEMRQDGREIDPTPWLDLDLRKAKRT